MGIVTIYWPHETDSEWYEGIIDDVKEAIQIAKVLGMDHRFTSSSSFIEWACDEVTAEEIRTVIKSKYPKLSVAWREK